MWQQVLSQLLQAATQVAGNPFLGALQSLAPPSGEAPSQAPSPPVVAAERPQRQSMLIDSGRTASKAASLLVSVTPIGAAGKLGMYTIQHRKQVARVARNAFRPFGHRDRQKQRSRIPAPGR